MTIDKAQLKALAKSATQGQWVFDGGTVNDWFEGEYSMEWMPNGEDCEDGTNANWKADAQYIAAANPETMLALLAEIDELRKDAERYRFISRKGAADGPAILLNFPTDKAPTITTVSGEAADIFVDRAMNKDK